jgi:hypothetical protein
MADTLYLSLWYPNLRLEALPGKLIAVLGAFTAHGGEAGVYSASVWPVNWSEAPVFQRIYGRSGQAADPRHAVEEALENIHDDYAYEFQIGWNLWELEGADAAPPSAPIATRLDAQGRLSTAPDGSGQDESSSAGSGTRWARGPRLVRVTGFGPLFDEGAYEQDGHIRIDFGSDAPFLEEGADLDQVGARHIEQNVRQLVDLTAAVEKTSGATARLLWSELGESLAARLAERLGMGN